MKNPKIKLNSNKRPFVMLYHDFIKSDLLSWNEKDLYIILLMYAEKDSKQCFPSISELCNISGKSKNTILKAISGLENKKILKKEKRVTKKGQTSNVYTLYDIDIIWKSETIQELKTEIDRLEEKRMVEALEAKGYHIVKEKELETEPAKVQYQAQKINNIDQFDTTTNSEKSQDLKRYTLDQIYELFDYDTMLKEHPDQQSDIDSIMNILHTTMNTTKATIRIGREDKPSMVVIAKLMKLHNESIMYAIDKYQEQTERIRNPSSYMLTILYNAPEQYYLDMKNQANNKAEKIEPANKSKKIDEKNKDSSNRFLNFQQRTYDYEKLEKFLLNN